MLEDAYWKWHTSGLAAVTACSEAVAASMVVNRARDKAVPAVLVVEVAGGGSRVWGSGGGGQASLGGWAVVNSCLQQFQICDTQHHVVTADCTDTEPFLCMSSIGTTHSVLLIGTL